MSSTAAFACLPFLLTACYGSHGHGYHKVKSDIIAIEHAAAEFAVQNGGAYPKNLEALVTPDEAGFTYLNHDAIPLDPWGNPYVYELPAEEAGLPRIVSYGADGVPGGKGDAQDIDNLMIKNREI